MEFREKKELIQKKVYIDPKNKRKVLLNQPAEDTHLEKY